MKNELSLQRMKALYESQRVLEVERKLFTNERHLQACQSENMNLRVMLDELKMKYEPEGKYYFLGRGGKEKSGRLSLHKLHDIKQEDMGLVPGVN